jgi:hypothetical protein
MYYEQESDNESENQDEDENENEDENEDENENEDMMKHDEKDIYSDEHVWDSREQRFRFRSEVWCSFEDEIYEKELVE